VHLLFVFYVTFWGLNLIHPASSMALQTLDEAHLDESASFQI
jgi:hypothetical protein